MIEKKRDENGVVSVVTDTRDQFKESTVRNWDLLKAYPGDWTTEEFEEMIDDNRFSVQVFFGEAFNEKFEQCSQELWHEIMEDFYALVNRKLPEVKNDH